jgi:hypothetical protein
MSHGVGIIVNNVKKKSVNHLKRTQKLMFFIQSKGRYILNKLVMNKKISDKSSFKNLPIKKMFLICMEIRKYRWT